MTFAPGTRLGPYEILAAAGAGGMGEVYRARDTRLDRTVAVKVLSSRFSASDEVRQRFEREARMISALSHPHICALYDVGNENGVEYLVMEFLEGETLASRLVRGPMPLETLVRTGTEVAEALDAAHRRGIVHRDLKPGNVMLTKSGVKLVDFGLAKLGSAGSPGTPSGASILATATGGDLTAEGAILGTFQYMAPEQLEGKPADARTDIFALGAVLYEMATGRKAFEGKSQASLIAAILERDPPPISAIQPMTPPSLDRLVKICIAKEPEDRWQTAGDVALQLRGIAESGSSAGVAHAGPAPRRIRREAAAWILAAVLAIVGAVGLVRGSGKRGVPRLVHASLLLPPKAAYRTLAVPELSPDGLTVVFSGVAADETQPLWIRSMASDEARMIPGTEGALFAFWSPDGKEIGFFSGGRLRRVDLAGGQVGTVCEVPDREARGGSWNANGVIIFAGSRFGALSRVAASGGSPEPLTHLDPSRGETSHRWPQFLPDGRHFVFFASPNDNGNQGDALFFGSLDGGHPRLLLSRVSNGQFAAGRLLFVREGNLLAQTFDPVTGALSGTARRIVENVGTGFGVTRAMFTASSSGTLVYVPASFGTTASLEWLDRSGHRVAKAGDSQRYYDARISPDGRRFVVGIFDAASRQTSLWTADASGSGRARATFGTGDRWSPIWSPDGTRILYVLRQDGRQRFIERRLETGEETTLSEISSEDSVLLDWSPDGEAAAWQMWNPRAGTNYDIERLSVSGRKSVPYAASKADETEGRFSPDGKWFVFTSNESGRSEVYVEAFPGAGGKRQISTDGGSAPLWPRRGREIFYVSADDQLMAVPAVVSRGLEIGSPAALFPLPQKPDRYFSYDAAPDGQRFLMTISNASEAEAGVRFVLDWTAELSR